MIRDLLANLLVEIREAGYLESSVDQISIKDSTAIVQLHIGPQYEWIQIDLSAIPKDFRSASGLENINWKKEVFQFSTLQEWKERLLEYAENNGYPFANTWLSPTLTNDQRIGGALQLELGPLILLDSISIIGDVTISKDYIQQYLGLEAGQPFSRKKVEQAAARLRDLPFLQVKQAASTNFSLNKAYPNVYIDKRKASRFDFIIGVLPNNTINQSLLITGDLEGEFINAFGRGERIYAHFEQLRPATQELELAFQYPYFFKLPLGADFSFNIYKRDSSFLDVELNLGVQYLLEGGNYFKAFYENRSSSLLNIDEALLLAQQRLPNQLDIRNTGFGLELLQQKLDYRFNPRRGWSLQMAAGAGTKRILRNNQIEAIDMGNLYDSLDLRSFQYQIKANAEYYLPLFKRSTLKLGANAGFLLSDAAIYQNEQFRIGGNRLLRGFDEEFFFATNYSVLTAEYRLLLSQNSFLFTFFDWAWVEDRTPERQVIDYPFGFGAGISLETSAGLFGISLAFGKQSEGNIDLNSPKVHFGYVSLF